AKVLRRLPEGVNAPKVIDYIPARDRELEMLVLSSVRFSEGMALPAEQWQPANAQSAARQIRVLETMRMEDVPELSAEVDVSLEYLLEHVGSFLPADLDQTTKEVLRQYSPQETSLVLVHRDLQPRNIVVLKTGECVPVDWEQGGAGYRGQDAGLLLWQLWGNESSRQAFIDTYIEADNLADRAQRLARLRFGVLLEFLRQVSWHAKRPDQVQAEIARLGPRLTEILATLAEQT
ncbi:MAG: phosphotransferase, partial [Patescibacteria group bacterium]